MAGDVKRTTRGLCALARLVTATQTALEVRGLPDGIEVPRGIFAGDALEHVGELLHGGADTNADAALA